MLKREREISRIETENHLFCPGILWTAIKRFVFISDVIKGTQGARVFQAEGIEYAKALRWENG